MAKRILIGDDSEIVRGFTRDFLERQLGLEVCGEAADGLETVEKAHRLNPDLIILDLAMPRMNGLLAARALRARSVHAPIILFTLYADVIQPREAVAAGISAVVPKGNLQALRVYIENLLTE